jgi:hypothetical protein
MIVSQLDETQREKFEQVSLYSKHFLVSKAKKFWIKKKNLKSFLFGLFIVFHISSKLKGYLFEINQENKQLLQLIRVLNNNSATNSRARPVARNVKLRED